MTAHEQAKQKLEEAIRDCETRDKLAGMLRQAVDGVRHHKSVTAALTKKFEALFPAYTISMHYDKGSFGSFTISIWGNGVDYNHRFTLIANSGNVTRDGWAAIDKELSYVRDGYIEAYRAELDKLTELDRFAAEFAALQVLARDYAVEGIDPEIRRYGPSSILEEAYPFLKRF